MTMPLQQATEQTYSYDNRIHILFIAFQASDGQSHVHAFGCSLTRAPTVDAAIIRLFGGCSSACLERRIVHVLVVLRIDDVLFNERSDNTCDVTRTSLSCLVEWRIHPAAPQRIGNGK